MLIFRLFLEDITNLEETLLVYIETSTSNSNFSSKDEIFKNIDINNIIFNVNQIINLRLYNIRFRKIKKSQLIINITNKKYTENKIFNNDIFEYPNLNLKSINNGHINYLLLKFFIPNNNNDRPLNNPGNAFITGCYDEITYFMQDLYDKKLLNEYTPNLYDALINSFCNKNIPFTPSFSFKNKDIDKDKDKNKDKDKIIDDNYDSDNDNDNNDNDDNNYDNNYSDDDFNDLS